MVPVFSRYPGSRDRTSLRVETLGQRDQRFSQGVTQRPPPAATSTFLVVSSYMRWNSIVFAVVSLVEPPPLHDTVKRKPQPACRSFHHIHTDRSSRLSLSPSSSFSRYLSLFDVSVYRFSSPLLAESLNFFKFHRYMHESFDLGNNCMELFFLLLLLVQKSFDSSWIPK